MAVRTRRTLPLLGPAFVAAVAYVDPGNFATNVTAGSHFGYLLVWVVLVSNLMAMLVQYLSAKVGVATGQSLPRLCRQEFSPPTRWVLWVQAELVAMATDLAEVVGGAVALRLLVGLPLLTGGLVTSAVAVALLMLRGRGRHRPFEIAVVALLAVILVAFLVVVLQAKPDPHSLLSGVVPRLDGTESLLLATAMLGATVMPHAIYLHGALTSERPRPRTADGLRRSLSAQRTDVVAAMSLAGVMNLALLVLAAAAFGGLATPVDSIDAAYRSLGSVLGPASAFLFAGALLAAGLASSSVGTLAGQVVMEGLLGLRVPLLVRRLVTLVPALVVLSIGVDPTRVLILSQVVLSFGIPFALVPLVLLTRRGDVMGHFVNRRTTTAAASVVAAVIVALNAVLVVELI